MTQEAGARTHGEERERDQGEEREAQESPPATGPSAPSSPFFLLESGRARGAAPEDPGDPASPGGPDTLARLARILSAAKSDDTLAASLRTVTAAWLAGDAWQVGLGVTRAPGEDETALSALAVADRDGVEPWRAAAAETDPESLDVLLRPAGGSFPASELPPGLAALATDRELDRLDLFPIEADGKVLAAIALLRAEGADPPAAVRRAMEMSVDILAQVAARARARTAVAGAARHIRALSEGSDEGGRAAEEAERRYDLLCRGAEPGLWDWDLEGDRLRLSPRWKGLLGHGARELTDRPSEWFDRIHADDADRVELELLEHLEGQSPRFESEHRLLHSDGGHRWVRVRGVADRDASGKAVRMAGSLLDISESRAREERTARDLMYHRLTGFPTTAMFSDRIEQAMRRRARRPDRSFAVLAVALDGLRESSDRIGNEATEEALLALGRRIASAIRPGDTVAHLDDLLFGVLLDDVQSLDDATQVTNRIVRELGQGLPLGSEELKLLPAIGLALSRTAYESAEEMVRDARIALRRALRDRTSLQVFDAATKAYAQTMVELEGDLRKAFDARELHLEYQPVVSLSDGRITGVEAYVRWSHPERGQISPAEFLPVAEEAGLIHELGYWVLERACRQMRKWIDDFNLRFPPNMAINLSEAQLFEETFVPRTLEIIEATGLEPKFVRLDISEGAFMKDGSAAGRILRALSQRGIRIAVDDFGTGYSSLSYLHRYPIGALKIDRAFVSGAAGTAHEWDVARTIIELAKILELEVIAEGIETREQFLRLRSLGCQQAQGFFFSGPASDTKTGQLIQNGYPLELAAGNG